MKKTRIISIALMCAMVSGSLWGCRETEQEEPVNTELKVLTQSVQVPVEGGEAVIEFSLTDPVEGAEVTVRPSSEWAHDPVVSMPADGGTKGSITLTVDANPDYTSRTADVKVSYTEGDFNYTVPIVQAGLEPEFQITATDPTTYSAIVSVTPLDKDMPYYVSYIDKEWYSEFENDNALIEYNYNLWVETSITLDDFLTNGLLQGDLQDTLTDFLQDTEYYVYAYGVDNSSGKPTTPIYKTEIKTDVVEKIDMHFDIEVNVKGNTAEIKYFPSDNTVPYFNAVSTKSNLESFGTNIEEQVNGFIRGFIDFIVNFGPYEFFEFMSDYGLETSDWDAMETDTDYVAFAVAWDGGCNLISDVSEYEFKTESGYISDNKISVDVIPGTDAAIINITATNEDPYVYFFDEEHALDGMTEEEAVTYLEDLYAGTLLGLDMIAVQGNLSHMVSRLTPGTTYRIIVFGWNGEEPNTAIQLIEMTTLSSMTEQDNDFLFATMIEENRWMLVSTTSLNSEYPFYTGIYPVGMTELDIKKDLNDKAAEQGLSLNDFLLNNAVTKSYVNSYEVGKGMIEAGVEYRLFAVTLTDTGEYAHEFKFSEPAMITSSSASSGQNLQTGLAKEQGIIPKSSSMPNTREDFTQQFNEYLKSR